MWCRETLVALIWASAALASPVEAEPIFGPDLDIRHSSLEARQSSDKCPSEYTTYNGFRFNTFCSQNNMGNDADKIYTDTMEQCMNFCGRFWGDGEGCFGVVWRESDKRCWLRNSTASEDELYDREGIHSAFAFKEDLKPLNKDCGDSDGSTHQFRDGVEYTLHCDKVIPGEDACFEGYANCKSEPYKGFYHATSLEECLGFCVDEHPRCMAVSYNPTLEIGFANCWLKTGFNKLESPGPKMGTIHTAAITNLERLDTNCPSETSTEVDGKKWDINCGTFNAGQNVTTVYAQNITGCVEQCVANDDGCVGIMFDKTRKHGHHNCYLQNTTSVDSDNDDFTYVVLSGTPLPSSDPSGTPGEGGGNEDNDDGGSSSQAWIAGPVVGGIVALALIGGGIFWWRRRKSRNGVSQPAIAEKDGNPPAPAYTPYAPVSGHHPPPPPSEMASDHPVEMAASPPAAHKYAHTSQPNAPPPQELPS